MPIVAFWVLRSSVPHRWASGPGRRYTHLSESLSWVDNQAEAKRFATPEEAVEIVNDEKAPKSLRKAQAVVGYDENELPVDVIPLDFAAT